MQYRLIDHTADLGIHVLGSSAKSLFVNAALAMFDLITDVKLVKGEKTNDIRVSGDDWPDLMVSWLRELLYLWSGKERLIKSVHIISISECKIEANVTFDNYNPDQHPIKNEIKAVTYHQIQVENRMDGWEARIIFDV